MTCCLVPPLSLPLRRALPVGLGLLLLAALVAGDAGAEAGGSLREENPAVGGREGPGAAQPGGPSPECRDGTEDELVALLADFAQEPSVQEVQQWAVGEALAEPSRAAALVRDARLEGALPLIRLRGRYEDGWGASWDELDLLDGRDKDTEYTLDLWLEWDLADLAASPDTLRAVREGRALAELRQGVVTQVTIAYFDRRRLLLEERLHGEGAPIGEALVRRLRVQELDATLDGLCGGRWTRSLRRSAASDPPPCPPGESVAPEPPSDAAREDPHPGLRVPVQPADRTPGP